MTDCLDASQYYFLRRFVRSVLRLRLLLRLLSSSSSFLLALDLLELDLLELEERVFLTVDVRARGAVGVLSRVDCLLLTLVESLDRLRFALELELY